MNKIVVISLAVSLGLALALTIGCGGSKNSGDLGGKIGWNEDYPTIYLFSKVGPPEQAYKVYVKGQLSNLSKDRLIVASLVIRLYNSTGEKLYEEIVDHNFLWSASVLLRPGEEGWGAIFNQFFAEEVVRYEVFITDSQGNEYACIRD